MPQFSPMHFPKEINPEYHNAGMRTQWATRTDLFSVLRPTRLYENCENFFELNEDDQISFVQPPRLHNGKKLGLPRGTYARAKSEKGVGFIQIGHVEKPRNHNSRMIYGASAQNRVADVIASDNDVSVVSIAKVGSRDPDIVFSGPQGLFQAEVKSTPSFSGPITVFDKSLRRHKIPQVFDDLAFEFAKASDIDVDLTENPFVSVMDHFSTHEPGVSFASDDFGVSSGKLPSIFRTHDPVLCDIGRSVILNHLHDSGDHIFAVYNRTDHDIMIYDTGLADLPIELKRFPRLKSFSLSTYGGKTTSGATRVGLKIRLDDT